MFNVSIFSLDKRHRLEEDAASYVSTYGKNLKRSKWFDYDVYNIYNYIFMMIYYTKFNLL
jgi:hypothetical protein